LTTAERLAEARANLDESNALLRATRAERAEDQFVLRKASERIAASRLLLGAFASPTGRSV